MPDGTGAQRKRGLTAARCVNRKQSVRLKAKLNSINPSQINRGCILCFPSLPPLSPPPPIALDLPARDTMADKASPEKKSWADVEEEEEAKAKAKAKAAAASSSSTSESAVEAQAKQIESLSLAPPEDDAAGEEAPPLLDDSDDAQIQAVRNPCLSRTPAGASPSQSRLLRVAD